MKPIKVVASDTGSQVYFNCISEYNNEIIILTDATVLIKWLNSSGVLQQRTMTIIDALLGRVAYKFAAGELYKPVGLRYLKAEIEITLPSTDVISSQDFVRLDVREQLP